MSVVPMSERLWVTTTGRCLRSTRLFVNCGGTRTEEMVCLHYVIIVVRNDGDLFLHWIIVYTCSFYCYYVHCYTHSGSTLHDTQSYKHRTETKVPVRSTGSYAWYLKLNAIQAVNFTTRALSKWPSNPKFCCCSSYLRLMQAAKCTTNRVLLGHSMPIQPVVPRWPPQIFVIFGTCIDHC